MPLGGPDGGNGGRGGDVVLVVDPSVATLLDFHFHPAPARHLRQAGRRAATAPAPRAPTWYFAVPNGTVVVDAETGEQLADLIGTGTRYVLAAGGAGGLGNAALASAAAQGARLRAARRAG